MIGQITWIACNLMILWIRILFASTFLPRELGAKVAVLETNIFIDFLHVQKCYRVFYDFEIVLGEWQSMTHR